MAPPVDQVDGQPKVPPGERIKPLSGSDPNKDRNGFARALREKMEEESEKENSQRKKDTVIISGKSRSGEEDHQREQSQSDGEAKEIKKQSEEKLTNQDHIDLKA
jgi:hypothetical protein